MDKGEDIKAIKVDMNRRDMVYFFITFIIKTFKKEEP